MQLDKIMQTILSTILRETNNAKQTTQTNNEQVYAQQICNCFLNFDHIILPKQFSKNNAQVSGGRMQLDKIMYTIFAHYFEETNNANQQRKQITRKFIHNIAHRSFLDALFYALRKFVLKNVTQFITVFQVDTRLSQY